MDSFKRYYNNLNSSQKKAVDATEGPLLILAGPGTGKTELLSVRAANILRKEEAYPENILILTYTNAAAKAMKERLVKIVGNAGYDIETGTFHSFANSIVLESEEAANYIQERIQITDIEKVKALEYILDQADGIDPIRPFRAPYIFRYEIEAKISELKKEGISPLEFEKQVSRLKPDGVYLETKHMPRLKALGIVYKLYEALKSGKSGDIFDKRGRYDFDDMIIFAVEALRQQKGLVKALREQYTHLMIDEFQDTNGAQMNLLFEIFNPKKPNLCCVGDDDQSIYRFQGASVGNFKTLKERVPETATVSLSSNYRSTEDIIQHSSKIISHLPEKERVEEKILKHTKDYKAKKIEFYEFAKEAEELLFITEKVKELKTTIEDAQELTEEERSLPYNNIAVLVRKRSDIVKLVDAFLQAGIPYATDGKEDISSQKRVRQMIDVLTLAHLKDGVGFAEKDAFFYRIITSDYFKIPLSDVLSFISYVKLKKQKLRAKGEGLLPTLLSEFFESFPVKTFDEEPDEKGSKGLPILKSLELEEPTAMHKASWALKRLISEAEVKPVHATLLRYIDDAGIYKYILENYKNNKILKIRDLRALSSFVNMVKETDINNPAISLADFIDEINTKKEHGIPLQGSLVTMTQEGVRIFTAHGSKGLEFHSVILPFCLQNKNWPVRARAEIIPLPSEIMKTKEKAEDKMLLRELNFYDETRLFYVASTRAKSHLFYTASPTESAISSAYLSNAGLYSNASESQLTEEEVMVKQLELTKEEDPFIGSEDILKDLISNLTLNPTSLNNYITCKRRFLYDNVLMLPSQKKLSLTFGNSVHKALEDVYMHFMEKGKFPSFKFFKESFIEELTYQGVEKSIRLGCLRQVETLKDWFSLESRSPVMPIGLEKKLAIMIEDDLIFTGKYDKTEVSDEKNKMIRVIDYKTGKPDHHVRQFEAGTWELSSSECDGYLRQLVAYKLLFDRDKDKNKGFKVKDGTLVFVEPAKTTIAKYGIKKGEFIKKTVEITDGMVLELEELIKSVWGSIKALDFAQLLEYDDDPRKCKNCDYKNICWN